SSSRSLSSCRCTAKLAVPAATSARPTRSIMPVKTRARMDHRRSGALVIIAVIVVVITVVVIVIVVIVVSLVARRRQRNDGLLWRCGCYRLGLRLRRRGCAGLGLFRDLRLGRLARAGGGLLRFGSRFGRRRGGSLGDAAGGRGCYFFEDEPLPEVLVGWSFQGFADPECANYHNCDDGNRRERAAQCFLS